MHGIHHVTAIAGNPARNLAFYRHTLGLRFVKKTVNFDDPASYHFYYGDEQGLPGTVLTFFLWEHAAPGMGGVGLAHTTMFRVPAAAIGFWVRRFCEKGVKHQAATGRFGEELIAFSDWDGMKLALVGVAGEERQAAWSDGAIPKEHAIRGIHGVELLLAAAGPTSEVLTDVLGFKGEGREAGSTRYRAGAGVGGIVDIREAHGSLKGRMGRGAVHHVAFRAADDAEQAAMAKRLVVGHRLSPTGQRDRQYFRSIYFHEPGGILFEIATDRPGFSVDEPLAELGSSLKLPPFLEPRRRELEGLLPSLEARR